MLAYLLTLLSAFWLQPPWLVLGYALAVIFFLSLIFMARPRKANPSRRISVGILRIKKPGTANLPSRQNKHPTDATFPNPQSRHFCSHVRKSAPDFQGSGSGATRLGYNCNGCVKIVNV
jgi:hypothetical protein